MTENLLTNPCRTPKQPIVDNVTLSRAAYAHSHRFFAVLSCGVKGAEREDPGLQAGDASGAALRHVLGEITKNYILL